MPVLLLAEIPFMMAKFAVFDAVSKLAYNTFPQAAESVATSLAVSVVSGMVGEIALSPVSAVVTLRFVISGESNQYFGGRKRMFFFPFSFLWNGKI